MAIHYACLYGHWACAQVLMDTRWDVSTSLSPRPLAHALISDMHGSSRYIDARTCAGLTPLHMAAWAGHAEVAKILLANGAALNPRIVFSSPSTSSVLPGSTPTHLATRKNRIHVVKALLSAYVRRLLLRSFFIPCPQARMWGGHPSCRRFCPHGRPHAVAAMRSKLLASCVCFHERRSSRPDSSRTICMANAPSGSACLSL